MAINKGFLTADRTADGDECYTPFYAVDPLLEFVDKDKVIWCPFDEEWSAFVQTFKENGNKVIYSHLSAGQDFFNYEPNEHYDIIISNPPFSLKDKVLERLYSLGKPFCILLPANSLQGKKRFKSFSKYGLELLVFDARVDYHTDNNFSDTSNGTMFGSAYFCWKFLPNQLVFRSLNKYEKPLIEETDNTNEE